MRAECKLTWPSFHRLMLISRGNASDFILVALSALATALAWQSQHATGCDTFLGEGCSVVLTVNRAWLFLPSLCLLLRAAFALGASSEARAADARVAQNSAERPCAYRVAPPTASRPPGFLAARALSCPLPGDNAPLLRQLLSLAPLFAPALDEDDSSPVTSPTGCAKPVDDPGGDGLCELRAGASPGKNVDGTRLFLTPVSSQRCFGRRATSTASRV